MNIDPSEAVARVAKKLEGLKQPFAFVGSDVYWLLLNEDEPGTLAREYFRRLK
jgi:hypothetical protein